MLPNHTRDLFFAWSIDYKQVVPVFKGKRLYKGMNSRKQGSLGAILMAFYHTDHGRGQRNKSECVPIELATEDNLNTNKNNYNNVS